MLKNGIDCLSITFTPLHIIFNYTQTKQQKKIEDIKDKYWSEAKENEKLKDTIRLLKREKEMLLNDLDNMYQEKY